MSETIVSINQTTNLRCMHVQKKKKRKKKESTPIKDNVARKVLSNVILSETCLP